LPSAHPQSHFVERFLPIKSFSVFCSHHICMKDLIRNPCLSITELMILEKPTSRCRRSPRFFHLSIELQVSARCTCSQIGFQSQFRLSKGLSEGSRHFWFSNSGMGLHHCLLSILMRHGSQGIILLWKSAPVKSILDIYKSITLTLLMKLLEVDPIFQVRKLF
jgi:hypothetical protein